MSGLLRNAVVLLFAIIFGGFISVSKNLGTVRSVEVVLDDQFRTPAIRVAPEQFNGEKRVAILIHGYQCNKSMMIQLARALAADNFVAYTIDLPGHGNSLFPFSPERAKSAVESAAWAIMAREGTEPKMASVIGHSYGATLAVSLTDSGFRVPSVVLIGPGEIEHPSANFPSNILILTAEHDYDFIKQFAERGMSGFTNGNNAAPNVFNGDFTHQSARLWLAISRTSHVDLLLNDAVYAATIAWLHSRIDAVSNHNEIGFRLAIAAISLLFYLVLFAAVSSERIDLPKPDMNVVRPLLLLGLSIILALVLAAKYSLLPFVRLLEGSTIAALILYAGCIGTILKLLFTKDRPDDRKVLGSLVAVLAFLLLYYVLQCTITPEFYNLRFLLSHPGRVTAFFLITVWSYPFFYLANDWLRQVQTYGKNVFQQLIIVIVTAVFFYGSLSLSFYALPERLFRFSGSFVAAMVYADLAAAIIYARTSSVSGAALFCSLLASLILSTGFIYV